jgi:hypothetical protein
VPWSSCPRVRCPASGASVQCPRVPVHATGVRCPVRASERPGVRRPVSSVSGVRACPRPLCPTGRSWRAAVGRQPLGWDGRGRGVVTRGVHDRLVVCPGRNLTVEAGAGRAGPAEASAWTWPWSWEVVGSRQVDRVADQDGPDARKDRPVVGEPGAQRGGDYAPWSSWRPRAESPGRCEPSRLDCDVRLRPCCGRELVRASPCSTLATP